MAWYEKPGTVMRHDGDYINLLNKFGSMQDSSSAWQFQREGIIPDMHLTDHYESNGLFAKIIDTPAEEAIKHGFDLGLSDKEAETYISDMMNTLGWDEAATSAIRWSRLYGGAIGLLLVDDGRGIDESLDWKNIKSIEEIRVYERAIVWPDYSVMYDFNPTTPWEGTTSKYGMPERYFVNSIFGQFWVHESRCLIFRNGILPERTMQPYYRFWGTPEYLRIKREMREASTSFSTAIKMLERSVQPVHGVKDLASILQQPGGVDIVLKRLQAVDKGRFITNTMAIDAEGESYEFKTFPLVGISDVIEAACSNLSAVTNIPQTILFGRSPAGMNSTGHSDFENYYNYVERIQKLNLRRNMQKLVDIIVCAGLAQGRLQENPEVKLEFNPLWSMDDEQQSKVNHQNAQTQQAKAQAARIYFDMGVIDPAEIRKGLAQEGEFMIEDLLESIGASYELPDPWDVERLPVDTTDLTKQAPGFAPPDGNLVQDSTHDVKGVGIIVMKGGKVLVGLRDDNGSIGGPGGHIEPGETPAQAAIRETQEEFGITPLNLRPLGQLEGLEEQHGSPYIYLCTDFEGTPECVDGEMKGPIWIKQGMIPAVRENKGLHIFPPFAASLRLLRGMEPEIVRWANE